MFQCILSQHPHEGTRCVLYIDVCVTRIMSFLCYFELQLKLALQFYSKLSLFCFCMFLSYHILGCSETTDRRLLVFNWNPCGAVLCVGCVVTGCLSYSWARLYDGQTSAGGWSQLSEQGPWWSAMASSAGSTGCVILNTRQDRRLRVITWATPGSRHFQSPLNGGGQIPNTRR
jgi:hypothetical protein